MSSTETDIIIEDMQFDMSDFNIDIPFIDNESFVISDEDITRFISETILKSSENDVCSLEMSTVSNPSSADVNVNQEVPAILKNADCDILEGNTNNIPSSINSVGIPVICNAPNQDALGLSNIEARSNVSVGRLLIDVKDVISHMFCRCTTTTLMTVFSIICGLIIAAILVVIEWRKHISHL